MNVKMSWAAAERACLSLDGNLASIRSTNEYNFIRQLVLSSSKTNASSWIGGHDSAEEGNWLWSDGSKFLFHHWGKGQPNNANGNEDCMEINFTEQDFVNDRNCAMKLPFICARPIKPSYAF
ncbi:galactose-specific lectin nattectin-like [Poecilia reticulata]|uniref:galactose-specific lectin nattectin-like n=1 Tax=Poecilia reticulata TaxID=8081 RepID=UPI0007EBF5F6|nr:PREDICTED: galactose-specific lectin nattectin-like [Poecilia reticulata]